MAELLIVQGPHNIAIGDVCRFVVLAEGPGSEQDERVRVKALNKHPDGFHFRGSLESEGVLSRISAAGVYDPSKRTGKIEYYPEDHFSDLTNGSL